MNKFNLLSYKVKFWFTCLYKVSFQTFFNYNLCNTHCGSRVAKIRSSFMTKPGLVNLVVVVLFWASATADRMLGVEVASCEFPMRSALFGPELKWWMHVEILTIFSLIGKICLTVWTSVPTIRWTISDVD